MKILITGNLGYVGPGLVREFREYHPEAVLMGYDIGYFAKYVTSTSASPDIFLDLQYYGDVRRFPERILEGVDAVVSLAAISNDPIGNKFEEATMDINHRANVNIARMAKRQGVRRFVFASSCSVYGSAEDAPRTESSTLDPLTAYARSKVYSEEALEALAGEGFQVTCLRFATACGMSERLRLDLVLNDFVAGALTAGKIGILSDGTPWRPLINVRDMARAIRWACQRETQSGGPFLTVNTGSNPWNFQIKDLALATQKLLPGVEVDINKDALPDKRSYRVDFGLFQCLAPGHQPAYGLEETVKGLIGGLQAIRFNDANYRRSGLIRLNVIEELLTRKEMDEALSLRV
ncbi:MAG: SDR family oxidoreductase [Lewinellaceae bacterium]|nr:SDR family oxidoreductase [Phaeodactylibacter sp.]MCB9035967.1 SDR family oxidoreductase [Lewinellaceae bacterium]